MISVKKEKIYIEIVCRKSNIPTFQHFRERSIMDTK
jgi:hypothetical protein